MVSHLNSFRYVEMDGEFIEIPCQNFEEVPQTMAATETVTRMPKITRPPLKIASLKDAKAVIEEGGVPFGANSLTFHKNLISLVWVSLQRIKGLFFVLALEDFPYASAIMGSTL